MTTKFHRLPTDDAPRGCPAHIAHRTDPVPVAAHSTSLNSEIMLHLLLENACQGVLIVDRAGTIIVANQVASKMFGYDVHQLIGKGVETLVPESIRSGHARHRAAFMDDSQACSRPMGNGVELNGVRKDGTLFPCEIGLSCMRSETLGALIVAFVTDITARKKMEVALQAQVHELERFANVLVHDLKAPIRSARLAGSLIHEALQEGNISELKDLCTFVNTATSGMHTLIDALHEYTKRDPQVSFGQTSMDEILSQSIANLKQVIAQSDAHITHDELPTVHGHSPQLVQLLQNLIANAVKYSQGGAAIHVSASKGTDDLWLFSVKDNGIGIPEKMLDQIFQPFTRACDRGKYEGTGLGLSTCKKIVERHKGQIWCESSEGTGTTFFFTLPSEDSSDSAVLFSQYDNQWKTHVA